MLVHRTIAPRLALALATCAFTSAWLATPAHAQSVDFWYLDGVATLSRTSATPTQDAWLIVDSTVAVYPATTCDCSAYPAEVSYTVIHDPTGDTFAFALTSWQGCQYYECNGSDLAYVLFHSLPINGSDFRAWASAHQSGTWSLRMDLHVTDTPWGAPNWQVVPMPVFTPLSPPEVALELDTFDTWLDRDAALPGQPATLTASGILSAQSLPGNCADGSLAPIPIAAALWAEDPYGDWHHSGELARTTVDPCDDTSSPNAPLLGFGLPIDVNAAAARAFLVQHQARTFFLELVADPDNTLAETNEYDNAAYWDPPRGFLPLSGALGFGPATTTIDLLTASFHDTAGLYGCDPGELLISGSASWPTSQSTDLADPVIPLQSACTTASASPKGFALTFRARTDGATSLYADLTTGTFRGLAAELSLVFDPSGVFGDGFVTLPAGLTAHVERPYPDESPFYRLPRPDARGRARLYFYVEPIAHPSQIVGIIGRRGTDELIRFLHADALPFSFLIEAYADATGLEYSMVVDPSGLHAMQIGTHYQRTPGRASNDARFAQGMAGVAEEIVIDARGLRTLSSFDANTFQTHYPAADVTSVATEVLIEGNHIVAGAQPGNTALPGQLPAASWTFTPATTCGPCGGKTFAFPVTFAALEDDLATPADEGLGLDGAIAFRTKPASAIWWGPSTEPPPNTWSYGEPLFSRSGDGAERAVFLAPGWHLPGTATATATAADALLGSWRVSPTQGWALRPVSTSPGSGADARAGSGAFAGLNVGPEVYRDAEGQPEEGVGSLLDQNPMRIGLGGTAAPHWATLNSSAGTKYVARQGGITGAFNFTASPPGNVYGYPMTFSRFAFRQRANIVDPYTWVDGAISLPGRAGFGTGFKSLAFTCTGQLAGGTVVPDATPQQLVAWSAPFDPYGLEFRPKANAGQCDSGSRDLWVAGTTAVKSLNRPLDLDAAWTPAGEPIAAKLRAADNTLDKPAAGRGFSVALATDAVLGPATGHPGLQDKPMLGWFGLEATLRLPFWHAMPVDLRLENTCANDNGGGACALDAIAAAPALVLERGQQLADQDGSLNAALAAAAIDHAKADENSPARLDPTYKWGNTGFDLELPAYYRGPGDADRPEPELTGIKLTADYPFVSVNAGVDWVRPDKTRVSFGASADFEKISLTGPLHIDLKDPKSVARIDYRLCQVLGNSGCTESPLTSGADFERHPVGSVVQTMQAPASFVLKNAGPGFQNLIRDAIAKAFEAVDGPALIDALAGAVSHVQALPSRAVGEVFGLIQAEANRAIGALTGVVGDAAAELYRDLPAAIDAAILEVQQTAQGAAAWYTDPANATLANTVRDLRTLLSSSGGFGGAVATTADAVGKVKSAVDTATATLVKVRKDMDGALQLANKTLGQVNGVLGQLTSLTQCTNGAPSGNGLWQKFDALHGQVTSLIGAVKTAAGTVTQFASGIGSIVGVDTKQLGEVTKKVTTVADDLGKLATSAKDRVAGAICKLPFASTLAQVTDLLTRIQGAASALQTTLDKLVTTDGQGGILVTTINAVKPRLDQIAKVVASLEKARADIFSKVDQLLAETPTIPTLPAGHASVAASVRALLDQAVGFIGTDGNPVPYCAPSPNNPCQGSETFVAPLGDVLRSEVGAVIGTIAGQVQAEVDDLMKLLPFPSGNDLRRMIYDKILNNPLIPKLEALIHENLALILKPLDQLGADLLEHINRFIKSAFDKLDQLVSGLLASATAAFKDFPFKGATVDGYAEINDRELLRLHIGAVFKMNESKSSGGQAEDPKAKEKQTDFEAALDVTSWAANGKGKNCGVPASGDTPGQGLLDANITVRNVPITIGSGNLGIRELSLGMTLGDLSGQGQGITLLGINGRLYTTGSLEFAKVKLYDMGLELGVGAIETYLGARASATFQGINMQAAFLAGKTCNDEVIGRLDPEAAAFMSLPKGVFAGIFVRGKVSVPIWNVGCLLRIGAGADVGFWYLDYGGSTTVGGILGGSVYGNLVCIVSVRGGVKLMAQVADGDVSLLGEAWGAGGIGFCEPEDWVDIPASRNDDWCGTADVSLKASYKNGSFSVDGAEPSALH